MSTKSMSFIVMATAVLLLLGTAHADLVAHWNLDDGAGDVATDSTGNGHDGQFSGSPEWVEGLYGGSLNFAGNPDRVIVPYSPDLNPETFTVVAWANVELGSSDWRSPITSRNDGPQKGYILYAGQNGNWQFWIGTGSGWSNAAGPVVEMGEWTHVAGAYETGQQTLYINGVEAGSASGTISLNEDIVLTIGAGASNVAAGNYFFVGVLDDVALFDSALTEQEIQGVMAGFSTGKASAPIPADGSSDIPRDVSLQWSAGKTAAEHDVYLGTTYDDVNNATIDDGVYMGRQTELTYTPESLALGETYFWRIDEVNSPPDSTVFKGDVWSFEVEPVAYAIPIGSVSATATSTDPLVDPANTVNGSGLNENDEHSSMQEDMWLGTAEDMTPSIQFELDKLQKLDKVHVWNHNTQTETILGFGFKEALIEYSADGETWSELGTVQFAQATGASDYQGEDIDLGGIMAKVVKITGLSNHSILGLPQKGLAEVRFYAVPVQAREPVPADGSTSTDAAVTLSWRSGREAMEHEVVFSADEQSVIDGSAVVGTVSEPSYDLGTLSLGTTYFWKINEMNDVGTPPAYEGDLWTFLMPEYLMLDDMEMYKAKEGLFIWEYWIDGFDNPDENGAVVGNGDYPETTVVYEGSQSLPIAYSNTAAPTSEATLQIDDENWLASGIQTLSLQFHGTEGNTGQLYVKINDTQVDYSGDVDDMAQGPWRTWNIDLATAGVALESITSLTIGVSGGGATGTLYVDDIRLYPVLGETITPVEPDAASLLAHYTFDGDFSDSAGNHDGTALGDAKIVSDPDRGQVLSLDGDDDAMSIPPLPAGTEVTISMWVNPLNTTTPSNWKSFFHGDGWTEGDIHWRLLNNRTNGGVNGVVPGGDLTGRGVVPYEQWSLVVLTLSPTEFAYWVNGIQDSARLLETGPMLQIGEGLVGGWLNGEAIEREWAGAIDDVRIYNRALSAAEVLWLSGKTTPVDKPLD